MKHSSASLSRGTILKVSLTLGPWVAAMVLHKLQQRCSSLEWLKSQDMQVWAGRSGRKIVPLCQGGQVSTQPPEESLVLALTSNSQGLSRLQASCRQMKASAKEYGNSKQSKGYYKENGNFNKPCKRRKASLCAGSVLHAYICQEKNFLDIKVL